MEERSSTPLADEYMQSLEGIKPAEASPYFYTKLKGRMQQIESGSFYKPAWAIAALCCFLIINIWMVTEVKKNSGQRTESSSPAQAFAETFNLNSQSNY